MARTTKADRMAAVSRIVARGSERGGKADLRKPEEREKNWDYKERGRITAWRAWDGYLKT